MHAARMFGVAVNDVMATLIVAAAVALAFHRKSFVKYFFAWSVALFALGVAAHRLFCVRTRVDRLLFRD